MSTVTACDSAAWSLQTAAALANLEINSVRPTWQKNEKLLKGTDKLYRVKIRKSKAKKYFLINI